MKNILLLDERDNVAIALRDLLPGETVTVKGRAIVCIKLIPNGHKFAIEIIKKDSEIIKYGEDIGMASCEIQPGDHVHIHNVIDTTSEKEARERARLGI